MRKEVTDNLRFKQNSDYEAQFANAYRELFEPIQPSAQLLGATRRLYQQTPRRQTIGRRFMPLTATLCAACLLLTLGIQFWPQPDDIAPPDNNMQMRMASQLDETAGMEEQAPMGRMAEPPAQSTAEDGIALLNDEPHESSSEIAAVPELCGLPPVEYAKQRTAISPQFFTQCIMSIIRWLGLW